MDDAELMQRWQRGDLSAFEALVRRWQQPIARFLFRLTGETHLVQDLSQEVFLRLYQAQQRYHENGAFSAWLYRIALNVARSSARRRTPVSLHHEPLDNPATEDEQRERAEVVAKAVAELPEPLRMVIALRHDEGMSFEEIARLTGTAASTWKSRFAKALQLLRNRLTQLGHGPEEMLS